MERDLYGKCTSSNALLLRKRFLRTVFRLKCDSDTLAAIGGAVAEEYYGWTGFYNEDELLKKYLDANLYNLVKLL